MVGLDTKKPSPGELSAQESLRELRDLVEAAGACVVREFLQKREAVDRALYIGKGLAGDLAQFVEAEQIDLAVFDTELSGTQLRNLEEILQCKILDRTGIILDIFAQRAKSKEGKIQVELAQLEYLLPRLVGKGTELSRLAGGIGTRGPGESKLERDRRHIKRRIADLKRQLAQVSKQRQVMKANRSLSLVTLVGYTNAGKSTLRYRLLEVAGGLQVDLTKEDAGTNQLFATLDSTVRGIELPNGRRILLADTVGFIQKLPHQLVSAFKATLEEVQEADLLLHVVDGTSPHVEEQVQAVEQVLGELDVLDKPVVIVMNKMDLLPEGMIPYRHPQHPVVHLSAKTGEGIDRLLAMLAEMLGTAGRRVQLLLPHEESRLLGELFRLGRVQEIVYQENGIRLTAEVPDSLYARLHPYRCFH